jgi:actin-like protein 6B
MEENGEPNVSAVPKKTLHVGQHGPNLWRPHMEIGNPLSEGISAYIPSCSFRFFTEPRTVTDFDPIQSLITHSLKEVMKVQPEEHPVLFTEPAWNTQANRERMAEIMFEEMNVPAFYIANSGVLNACVRSALSINERTCV